MASSSSDAASTTDLLLMKAKSLSSSTLDVPGGKISLISRVKRSLSSASSATSNNTSQNEPKQYNSSSLPKRFIVSGSHSSPRLTDSAPPSHWMSAVREEDDTTTLSDSRSSTMSVDLSVEMMIQQQRDHYRHVTKRSPPATPTKRNSQSPTSMKSEKSNSSSTLFSRPRHPRKQVKNLVVSNSVSVMWAPPPAMYWSRPAVHGAVPKPVRAHTSVVVDDLMYVFGGTDGRGCLDMLYALELDTFKWIRPTLYGERPPASRAHSMVAHKDKVYIFGGGDGTSYTNDLYVFDTVSMEWSKPDVMGTPPSPRRAHTSVVYGDSLYIFGGGDSGRALNDLYALKLDAMTWTCVETRGQKPSPRGYHTATLIKDCLVVYGGSDGHSCFSDVYILKLETRTWTQVDVHLTATVTKRPKRLSHAAIAVGSYIFISGGHDGTRFCDELLLLNLVTMTWETRKVYGQAPSPRGYHTMLLYDSRLFLQGGYDGKSFYNQVNVLDLSSHAYLAQVQWTIDV